MMGTEKTLAFVKGLLRQGMQPGKISLGVALGGVLGIFPVLGVTTLLCFTAAAVLRLNHALIQAVNYAVYPLQLILLGGYYALGVELFAQGGSPVSLSGLTQLLQEDPWGALLALKQLTLCAVALWLVTGIPLALVLFLVTRAVALKVQGPAHRSGENPCADSPSRSQALMERRTS
jgi:uncharacterized protein (DUF2062 family)